MCSTIDPAWLEKQFEVCRGQLRDVAYRMLGSLSEADDAVQEAWLRLSRSDITSVENIGGWLTTVVAHVSLDALRSRKRRAEEPIDATVLLQRADEHAVDAESEMQLADSVGLALLVLLDRLDPVERLAYVLHDMFDLPFDDIGRIVDRTPTAARKLASRARQRLHGGAPPTDSNMSRQRELAEAFLTASRDGDFRRLLEVLAPNVVLRADAAAVRGTDATEIRGATSVARGALAFSDRVRFAQLVVVNGRVGVVIAPRGRLFLVLAFTIAHDKIMEIEVIANALRLDQLELALLGD
jgi:RNA polymerase sigma-70 factor (ECF subfamily)